MGRLRTVSPTARNYATPVTAKLFPTCRRSLHRTPRRRPHQWPPAASYDRSRPSNLASFLFSTGSYHSWLDSAEQDPMVIVEAWPSRTNKTNAISASNVNQWRALLVCALALVDEARVAPRQLPTAACLRSSPRGPLCRRANPISSARRLAKRNRSQTLVFSPPRFCLCCRPGNAYWFPPPSYGSASYGPWTMPLACANSTMRACSCWITSGPTVWPSRTSVLASGTFSTSIRQKLRYTRLARTLRCSVS